MTARAIARTRLEQVLQHVPPLSAVAGDDPARALTSEGVHDFRVAVRRFRSWLRACEPLLGADVPRPLHSALRRLARCAGRARDAQVQWLWLRAVPVPCTAGASRAAAWYAALRAADFARDYVRLQRLVAARWPALAASLGEALHDGPASHGDLPATLNAHLGSVIAHHIGAAQRALDRVEHTSQVEEIHRARIQLKRLRYVVEAVHAPPPSAVAALQHLKRLQDVFGELHDAHVLSARVSEALGHSRRRGAAHPAQRDTRALRAALRRAELSDFRISLDQLAAPQTAAMWTAIGAVARQLSAT